jgi:hypothetical protein
MNSLLNKIKEIETIKLNKYHYAELRGLGRYLGFVVPKERR